MQKNEVRKMNRNLDGIYFRVKRNNKYENVCFSDLTETERDEICKDRPAEWFKSVAYHLAERLQAIGDVFDIVGR
jgi:hypothetical protein